MLGTGYSYRMGAKEKELEAVLRATPFMLTRCSRDLRFRFVSESYAAMFGQRPEDLVGKPIVEVIGEEAFGTVFPHVEKVLDGDQVEYEARISYQGIPSRIIRFVYTPDKNENGEVVGWVASLLDVTDQTQAQERERILLLEIQHRSNNLLAVIQAIAHQSLAGHNSPAEAKAAFESRLQALARINRQLMQSNWQGIELREIVRQELEPFVDRSTAGGVNVVLEPKQAQNVTLALHELATNACKYGALSNDIGNVEIAWAITGNGQGRTLSFRWRERGGPPASEPTQLGFGTALLKATFPGIALHYTPQGFNCEIELPLKEQAN
jgi:PAS domain S-box-containing protein